MSFRRYPSRRSTSSKSYARFSKRKSIASFSALQVIGIAVLILVLFVLIQQFQLNFSQALYVVFSLLSIILLAIIIVGVMIYLKRKERWRALKISGIDQLTGIQFEHYLVGLLQFKGFKDVTLTPPSGDFGADLIAKYQDKKVAIQAKQYNFLGPVGVEAVYQVLGGERQYYCDETMVITTGYFTPQAIELSNNSKTTLINRDILLDWVTEYTKK
jgi:restriction system protein